MKKYIAILCVLLTTGCTQIDTGNVGLETTLGKVGEQSLPQGIYFTLFKTVHEITAKEVSFSLENMTPKSNGLLTMADVDVDIYYKTSPDKVRSLYVKYQGDILRHDQIVKGGTGDLVVAFGRVYREAREAIYKAIASFDASTMHTQRTEITEAIRSILQAELDKTDPGAFVITAVNLRNMVTDKAIEESIRANAATDAQIAKKHKEIELAKAEASRLIEQARGEAQANEIVARSLTGPIKDIRLAEIQRDTAVALAGKAGNTILLGSPATPLIQVK